MLEKVSLTKLKEMDYENGRNLLESLGYVGGEPGTTESNISDWVHSEYFTLYDTNDDEVDKVSYDVFGNNRLEENEEDEVIREEWCRIS